MHVRSDACAVQCQIVRRRKTITTLERRIDEKFSPTSYKFLLSEKKIHCLKSQKRKKEQIPHPKGSVFVGEREREQQQAQEKAKNLGQEAELGK